jgi:uncharacterized membrane protein YeaQ/YmgE (transglycosylase-associated protein family)
LNQAIERISRFHGAQHGNCPPIALVDLKQDVCQRIEGYQTVSSGDVMGLESILIMLVIGAVAGWLAGVVVKGGGFGLVGDIVVGIVGALIAGYLFPTLGFDLGGGIIGTIIAAAIGAIILLVLIKLIKRA